MRHPFFSPSPRRGPSPAADLAGRIEAELLERLEEAVELACLETMVERRRALGLPAPVADSARDRQEFRRSVRVFLEHLDAQLGADLPPRRRPRLETVGDGSGDDNGDLLAVQALLARELPDYWQRFEACWAAWSAAASRGERRGLLGRLFGGS